MRPIHLLAVFTLILSALVFAYSQAPQRTSQPLQTAIQAAPVKAKKLLVRELPKGLEGIVLKDGVFRLSPGFKFLPRTNSTVALIRNEGGPDTSGSFECSCAGASSGGTCSSKVIAAPGGGTLSCTSSKDKPCSGDCLLVVTIDGSKTKLAIY